MKIVLSKPTRVPALALALLFAALAPPVPAGAQSAVAEGQKLAFDRGKGNCLTCHVIKGGDLPGTIGPELIDIKKNIQIVTNWLRSYSTRPNAIR